MPEHAPLVPSRHSVFVRLVAIMIGLAACIIVMVAAFFAHVVNPRVDEALDRVLAAYAETVAAQAPDVETAREISRRVGLIISYRGPRGAWTTGAQGSAPSADPALAEWTGARHVVASPAGGEYGFSWEIGIPIKAAHDRLLILLLLLIVGVVVLAHEVLRYSLRSVRLLYAGVERIGNGDLDVAIPRRSSDELGALTDAFNQMAARIREMLAVRDQLLLDVSHELRSPLTRMKVALALLPEGEKRTRMEADVNEMERMIRDILELERLRDARGLRREPQDLVAVVREAAEPFAETRPGVTLAPPKESAVLSIDEERIRTVLRNVLDNAVKYSLPDSRPVTIAFEETPHSVVVRVSDNGPGIARADLRRVFEPFVRVDPSRSKKTGGVGLGLSICTRVMEAHGGSIHAESNPERGVTIVLTFPR